MATGERRPLVGRLETHCDLVARRITAGRVIPFLGAGVNLCGRPSSEAWQLGRFDFLPSGAELSYHLASSFKYPRKRAADLLRVAQFVILTAGQQPLYEELRKLFDGPYPPTQVHRLLAELPRRLREQQLPVRYQLIITTNYDHVLERAFEEADEEYDVVTYEAIGRESGTFVHIAPDGTIRRVTAANEYTDVSTERRTVILKMHGAVDRLNENRDSFVITEDDYIAYLVHSDLRSLIPVKLLATMEKSHFLFLGYSLRDWNMRVILHRIWSERRLNSASWAIQLKPERLEKLLWQRRAVEILPYSLEEYIEKLDRSLAALQVPTGIAL
jgi:SIR2-like domain